MRSCLALFAEVRRSNMSKVPGMVRREDGKIMKGPHYTPPNIRALLAAIEGDGD